MGVISKQLKRGLLQNLKKKVVKIEDMREAKKEALKTKEMLESLKSSLDNSNSDPLHLAYISIFGLISTCMYGLAGLKEMKAFSKTARKQEDLYMPGGPPMSPLTDSYYSCWELLDFRFGPDNETLSSIFLDLAPDLKLSNDEIDVVEILNSSRMGIYEVTGREGDKIWLKELVTNEKFLCVCPAGYKGKVGQLWLVRILPPLYGYVDYSLVMTTPYVLVSKGKKDWIDFFRKNNINKDNLHDFMKFGRYLNFWNEFIFYGFFNFTDQAIFLSGFPDEWTTLPCHKKYNDHEKTIEYADKFLRKEDKDKIMARVQSSRATDVLKGKKASEVFLDYAMPILESISNKKEFDLNKISISLRVPWMIWNACVYDQSGKKGHSMLAEIKNQVGVDQNFKNMVRFLEERKKKEFSQYNYLMGDYELIPKENGEFNLRMESRLL